MSLALIDACRNENWEKAARLIGTPGIDVNFVDQSHSFTSALQLAASFCHFPTVALLIQNGANVKEPNEFGMTALHCAMEEILNDASCYDAAEKIVSALLVAGADVNISSDAGAKLKGGTRNRWNFTPLSIASALEFSSITKILIRFNADLNAPTMKECTPLMYAVQWRSLENVETLLRAGANMYIKDEAGNTVFFHASTPVRGMHWSTTNRLQICDVLTRYDCMYHLYRAARYLSIAFQKTQPVHVIEEIAVCVFLSYMKDDEIKLKDPEASLERLYSDAALLSNVHRSRIVIAAADRLCRTRRDLCDRVFQEMPL